MNDIYMNVGDWTGSFVNIVEFIGIFIAIGTFVVAAFLPIIRPVRSFLGKYKLPVFDSFWLVWKCREKPRLMIRYYIESAIFFSEGFPMSKEEWKELRHVFSDRLDEFRKNGAFIIPVDSVSVMIAEDVKNMIAEYFSFLAGEASSHKFWTKANKEGDNMFKDSFCATVSVSNGYLAPLARIVGINDRYENNWRAIMENFADTCNGSLLSQPYLSYTYTWLMWGPSIQTSALDQAGSDVLGIYGYTDEANSFFVTIPADSFKEHFNNGVVCEPCTISGHIVNPLIYVPSSLGGFNKNSHPFLNRIRHQYRVNHDFIFDADKISVEPEHDHYFTAYVWGMFLASRKDTKKPVFRFSDSIVYFEHTNLSDRNGDSLKDVNRILARKFQSCFKSEDNKNLTFHYVSALNEETARVLKEELDGMENVSFDYNYHIAGILEAIDSHFNTQTWSLLPKSCYGDIVSLYTDVNGAEETAGLTELFGLLGCKNSVVIAIRNSEGELDAAGVADLVDNGYKVIKLVKRCTSVIKDSDVLSFTDEDIREFISAGQQ